MSTIRRRVRSVPSLVLAAVALTALVPLWLPLAAVADLAGGRRRLPTVRLLSFGLLWAWCETAGVAAAFAFWVVGRAGDERLHSALQRWWVTRLVGALRLTTGITIVDAEADALVPGPAVMLCRHASLADSLVSAWVITSLAGLTPRYVLKKELLADPCLDIVGNRLPNYFLDREAVDSAAELEALRRLAGGLRTDEMVVIFPEGTRASPQKRARALTRIAERDTARAVRLGALQHLLPPRPAGSAALVEGCPRADVVLAWHVGFDGLDTFGGILRHLARPPHPVRFRSRRIPRAQVPTGDAFSRWLDDQWLAIDTDVHDMLTAKEGPA